MFARGEMEKPSLGTTRPSLARAGSHVSKNPVALFGNRIGPGFPRPLSRHTKQTIPTYRTRGPRRAAAPTPLPERKQLVCSSIPSKSRYAIIYVGAWPLSSTLPIAFRTASSAARSLEGCADHAWPPPCVRSSSHHALRVRASLPASVLLLHVPNCYLPQHAPQTSGRRQVDGVHLVQRSHARRGRAAHRDGGRTRGTGVCPAHPLLVLHARLTAAARRAPRSCSRSATTTPTCPSWGGRAGPAAWPRPTTT